MRVLHVGMGAMNQAKVFFEGHKKKDDVLFVFHFGNVLRNHTKNTYYDLVSEKRLVIQEWAGIGSFISFNEGPFDTIYSCEVFTRKEYLKQGDKCRFLEKVDGLLKKGGSFILLDSFNQDKAVKVKRFFEGKGYALEVSSEKKLFEDGVRLAAKKPP